MKILLQEAVWMLYNFPGRRSGHKVWRRVCPPASKKQEARAVFSLSDCSDRESFAGPREVWLPHLRETWPRLCYQGPGLPGLRSP